MDYSGPVSDILSPESTVTSLLSSSGHLRSSLQVPEHNTTFRYRDKDYGSASAALDAYIADYERSRRSRESLTGRLVLPHIPPSTPRRPGVSTLRNKDVLREHLTERELDFLNLPVSSLHHHANRDRLSMTTDELLSIPHDGSMPVTHTSAFIQGFMSQSAASHPCPTSSRPAHRPWDGLSSNLTAPRINHSHSHTTRMHRSFRGRSGAAMLKPDVDFSSGCCFKSSHRAARSERANPSSSLHLPHWLTSNKSEMNCSGITSVPDLKYPAWVQHCDLSEPPVPAESELWDHDHGVPQPGSHRARAPSWVEELEDDFSEQTSAQVDSQQTLRDLRLQFAEQISLLAAEKKSSDIMETLYRDNKIESLIQKADQVLNSLSQNSGGAGSRADSVSISDRVEKDFSPLNTEELLHCPQFTQDSAAAEVNMEVLTDRGAQAQECGLHGNSSLKQPGPAEALKQMLFRLQAVEAELQRQQTTPATPTEAESLQTDKTPVKPLQSAEGEAELECVSGGASLQRALHHLSRLKMLVEEPREKHTQEVEEKDEGHCSSSSADGLSSIQQKPS